MTHLDDIKEYCRYSDVLFKLVSLLGAKKLLFFDGVDDYQGHLDVDILLVDGRVFSYKYYYGSCSGCDEWEGKPEEEVFTIMGTEATIFDDYKTYLKWAKKTRKGAVMHDTMELLRLIGDKRGRSI